MVSCPGSLQAPVGSGNNHIPPTDKLGAPWAERGQGAQKGKCGGLPGTVKGRSRAA